MSLLTSKFPQILKTYSVTSTNIANKLRPLFWKKNSIKSNEMQQK